MAQEQLITLPHVCRACENCIHRLDATKDALELSVDYPHGSVEVDCTIYHATGKALMSFNATNERGDAHEIAAALVVCPGTQLGATKLKFKLSAGSD